jgi:uncharacterized repeat protein (TIGR01451 family)
MAASVRVSKRLQVGIIALIGAGLALSQRNLDPGVPLRLAAGGSVAVAGATGGIRITEDSGVATTLNAGAGEHAFGQTLATDGATVAIGAAGAVFFYSKPESDWVRTGSIRSTAVESIAVSGGTAVAGGAGQASVYVLNNGAWALQQQWTGSDRGFGAAVAVDGDTAMVASPTEQAVYLYGRTGTVWYLQSRIAAPGGSVGFASRMALAGGIAFSAAPGDATHAGEVFAYRQLGAVWVTAGSIQASTPAAGDGFGGLLAATADRVAAGSASGAATYVSNGAFWDLETAFAPAASNGFAALALGNSFAAVLEKAVLGAAPQKASLRRIALPDRAVTPGNTTGSAAVSTAPAAKAAAPALASALAPRAQTYTVSTINDNAGDNSTLRWAVNNAPAGSNIVLNISGTINLGSVLIVTQNLSIQGVAGMPVILNGQGTTRIFYCNNANVSISNVTLNNGYAKGGNGGGGEYAGGGAAGLGGAVVVNGGSVTFSNVTFSNNKAVGGNGGPGYSGVCCDDGGGSGGGIGGDGVAFPGGSTETQGGSGGIFGGSPQPIPGEYQQGLLPSGDGAGGNGQVGFGSTDISNPCPGYGGGEGGSSAGGGPNPPGGCPSGFGGGTGGGTTDLMPFGGEGPIPGWAGAAPNTPADVEAFVGGAGAGLGGAIFVRTGSLYLFNDTFTSNTATAGQGGGGSTGNTFGGLVTAQAKGGAVFSDSPGTVYLVGTNSFSGSVAAQAGQQTSCQGPTGAVATDSADICGGVVTEAAGPTALALAVIAAPAHASSPATLTATVTSIQTLPFAVAGLVDFYDGDLWLGASVLASGQASVTTPLIRPGKRLLRASYNGSVYYASSTGTAALQVASLPGAPGPPSSSFAPQANAYNMIKGDFNGDGILDLAFSNLSGIDIHFGKRDGSFGPSNVIAVNGSVKGIAADDFNETGFLGLAVGGSTSVTNTGLAVYPNLGLSQFYPAGIFGNNGAVNALAVADFNGDGHPDAAMAVSGGFSNAIVLLLTNAGTGQLPKSLPSSNIFPTYEPVAIVAGDFNRDGKADLAWVDASSGVVSVALGNGDGTFQSTLTAAIHGAAQNLVTGDFNGDGVPDLAVTDASGVTVLLGNGDGTFNAKPSIVFGATQSAIASADLNGDGMDDLIVGARSAGQFTVLLATGSGGMTATAVFPLAAPPIAIATGDFNGDGVQDYVVATSNSGAYVYLGVQTLVLTVQRSGSFYQSESGATYTFNLNNYGTAAATGPFIMTLSLPANFNTTAISGAGWSCTAPTVVCTYAGPLPSYTGAGLLIATGTIDDESSAMTATATLTANGLLAASASDTTTPLTPAVTLSFAQQGSILTAGSNPKYTFTAKNNSPVSLIGTATLNATMPANAVATSAGGTGWVCQSQTGSAPACTFVLSNLSASGLAPGASLAPVTIAIAAANGTALSSGSAVLSLTNGGSGQSQMVAAAVMPAGLAVSVSTQGGAFQQGQTGIALFFNVTNIGPASTTGSVTVQSTAGTGLTLTSLSGSGWNCSLSAGSCTRSDAIFAGGSFPVIQAVGNLAGNAPASVTETAAATAANSAIGSGSVTLAVTQALLGLQISHSGNFSPGQIGASYTLLVRNAGNSSTNAGSTVQVTDNVPTGLTATSISGTGWACTLATVSCTRSDSLPPGYSYPAISLVVNVVLTAPGAVLNTATLSGLGAASFGAYDYTIIGAAAALTELAPSPAIASVSQMVTLSAQVTSASGPAPTGSVIFLDNGNAIGGGIISSQIATFKTNLLAPGVHLIQTVYGGDSTYGSAKSTFQSVTVRAPATSGQFVFKASLPGGEETQSVLVFDFNGDGIPDIAVPSTDPPGLSIYSGNGDGTFNLFQTLPVSGAIFTVITADLNGDGLPDLVITGTGGITTALKASASLGYGFPPALPNGQTSINTTNCQYASNQVSSVVSGDFNLDGRVDVATVNTCGNLVELFGNGDGTFGAQLATLTGSSSGQSVLTIGDFNGDGLPDFIVTDPFAQKVHVLLSLGGGSLAAPINTILAGSPAAVAVGDFNGDGRVDIAVALGGANGQVCVLAGNGNGTFQAPAATGGCLSAPGATGVTAGDFNGDGKLDLAYTGTGNTSGNPALMGVALGNGDGTLQTPQLYPASGGRPYSVATGDFNGDGVVDLLVNNFVGNLSLYFGVATKWSVAIAPTASLAQGQQGAQYNVTATNSGTGASSGTVNAAVTFPAGGVTATNIAGTGWTCTLATLTCTRTDAVAAGSPYPAIAVTVNVSASAPPLVTATATVSGGGAPQSASAQNSSLTVTNTVQLSLTTALTGAAVTATVNGTTYTLPAQVVVPANLPVTIAITSPQAGAGGSTQYIFAYWSDGGAISHSITPAANTALTVYFLTQYLVTTSVYPPGAGTVTAGAWYNSGWQTVLTASPNAGYVFFGYSGTQGGSSTSLGLAVNGPTIEVANFTASTPALSATVATKANGSTSGQRVWTILVSNKGQGTAANVVIGGATVTVQSGPGPVSVVTAMPVPVGSLPAGQSGAALLTLNFPATTPLTIVQLQLTLSANGGTYTDTVTLNTQLR